ncbi:MAG: hypothetical protein ACOC1X_01790 [Promethearchaeota archaeon]
MKRSTLIIIILSVVLAIVFSYIGYKEYQTYESQKEMDLTQEGIQKAVDTIVQETSNCNTITLSSGNDTVTIASVKCIREQFQEQLNKPFENNNK